LRGKEPQAELFIFDQEISAANPGRLEEIGREAITGQAQSQLEGAE